MGNICYVWAIHFSSSSEESPAREVAAAVLYHVLIDGLIDLLYLFIYIKKKIFLFDFTPHPY